MHVPEKLSGLIMTAILAMMIGCDKNENKQLADMAERHSRRQAEQSKQMAELQHEVAEGSRLRRAGIHTRGFDPFFDPMLAEITFLRDPFLRMKKSGIIRAHGHAASAANTSVFIDCHDTVLADV